jgi:multidrug efflux pump subunit AcrB
MKKELAMCFFLACSVVLGAIWILSESVLPTPTHSQIDIDTRAQEQAYLSHPVGEQNQALPSVFDDSQVAKETLSNQGMLIKCVSNGKTTYSDEGCPTGAKVQQVKVHDSSGVVSPPKETLADLTAWRIASEQAYTQHLQQQVVLSVQSRKAECDELGKYIERLNSMARQPQSGQMQDWIKEKKAAAQSREYAAHC